MLLVQEVRQDTDDGWVVHNEFVQLLSQAVWLGDGHAKNGRVNGDQRRRVSHWRDGLFPAGCVLFTSTRLEYRE